MGGSEREGTCFRGITYSALHSQKAFHRSPSRFKGFSGPIGSGKSVALCQEAIRLSYMNPGRMGLIGAPTYPMLRDATQPLLFDILEGDKIPFEHNKADNIVRMLDTGTRIVFRPLDDYERLRGTNLAWFGVDELTYTPEAAWLRLEGRVRDPKASRLCGFAVWTPKGYDWVYERFIVTPKPGYQAIIAKPNENRHLLKQVPDFYDRLKDSYDEKFFQQEVLGQYLNMQGGRVYHAFSRADHLADLKVDPWLPLLWALDFNVDPMSSVVAQIKGSDVRVLAEIVLRHASTEEACLGFYEGFGAHPAGVIVYGDASGNSRKTSGSTDYQIIREFMRARGARFEYRVPKQNPQVRDRVQLVNARLRSASGEVHLRVDRKCTELMKDFEQVSYKEHSNEIDKDRDRRRSHLSDALGYLVWQECRPGEQAGEKGHGPLM